jgi:acetolactate synthase I/II/III large subunit
VTKRFPEKMTRLAQAQRECADRRGEVLTGAEILWDCLVREGVEVVFGYPGGAIMPAYDALPKYPIHHVLVRHEQGASHMADGYARASGKVGVCIATSGPGATNLVTGIANAMMDSIPMVAITGQVSSTMIGTDAFQETDITGVTLPITKHNYLVTRVEDLAKTLKEAFYVARSGRPGPVLVDISKDAQQKTTQFTYPEKEVKLPGYRPDHRPLPEALERALKMIAEAERPILFAGHGIVKAQASGALLEFVARSGVPVASTLLGLGGFPATHPLSLGMMGMHGEAWVNTAIQEADLIIALGMRFDDRVTGNLKTYATRARKIHVEIDPAEINKNVKVDLPIVADVREVLTELLPRLEKKDRSVWIKRIEELKGDSAVRDIQTLPDEGKLYAAHVIHDLWRLTDGKALMVTDVGQHQMWEAQYYRHDHPRKLITSGGLGTMGFALPAAIGSRFAQPEDEIWVVAGDGGFQMTACELSTIAQEGLKVNIAIINNGFLGMVRQWQEFFYERRYVATPMLSPDFVKLAEAHGLTGMRATKRSEVAEVVKAAQATPGAVVIDFRVEQEDSVYPMVPAGADLHKMIRRPIQERIHNPIYETGQDEDLSMSKPLRTFVVHVEDLPGVLNRVASLFRRRAYNIESLNVGRTHEPGVSRMTIVVEADDATALRIESNLYKLVNVLRVDDITQKPQVARSLALLKVNVSHDERPQVLQICEVFRARVVDMATDCVMVEITGAQDKIDGLVSVLRPFGITEMVQTGTVAMARGSESTSLELGLIPANDRPIAAA